MSRMKNYADRARDYIGVNANQVDEDVNGFVQRVKCCAICASWESNGAGEVECKKGISTRATEASYCKRFAFRSKKSNEWLAQ
jgi:hypothetical protein